MDYTLAVLRATRPAAKKRCAEAHLIDDVRRKQPIMKFFVDTADMAEIRDLAATGLLDGVTTNPSLIAKSGRKILDVIAEICDIVARPGERRGGGDRSRHHARRRPQAGEDRAERRP
jgi:hypothetical protein